MFHDRTGMQEQDSELPADIAHARRRLLRAVTLGITSVTATISASQALIPTSMTDVQAVYALQDLELEQARSIALASRLLRQTSEDLQQQGFVFTLSRSDLVLASGHNRFAGLTFHSRQVSEYVASADIVLTIDMESQVLTSIQSVVGWSREHSLEVHSSVLDVPGHRYEQRWTFPREEGAALRTPVHPTWFYRGCQMVDWGVLGGQVAHRCVQMVEAHTSGDVRTLTRTWSDYEATL